MNGLRKADYVLFAIAVACVVFMFSTLQGCAVPPQVEPQSQPSLAHPGIPADAQAGAIR